MAKAPSKKSETTITRIKASESAAPVAKIAKNSPTKTKKADQDKTTAQKASEPKIASGRRNPLKAIGGYFKGAWQELRQVRWPDRRATWGMTGALVAFTVFFVVVILVIDYGFGQLFNLITGK
ncbi:MAG: preprotein translocase subunit SecE [Candidatus Saccharimonas sp.]